MPLGNGKCKSKARLDGKTAVITGCNTGIGKETVKDFVKRGCRVVMACRDVSKAEEAAKEIRKETEGVQDVGVIVVVRLDLSSFASVRQCAEQLLTTEKRIDLLINNAGVMLCPKGSTEDGFETQFGTNHLGHFLFTLLLLPKIRKSTPARIVTVSSLAHEQGANIAFDDLNWDKKYNARLAYGQSKLANVLFSAELATRLKAAGINDVHTYSLHPGVIDTDLTRHMDKAYFTGVQWMMKNVVSHVIKTPLEGAQTTIYCAVDEKAANETGLYYSDCVVKKPSSKARDPEMAKRLWEVSMKLTGLQAYDPFTAQVTSDTETKVGTQVKIVKELVKEVKEGEHVEEDISRGSVDVESLMTHTKKEDAPDDDGKVISDCERMGITTTMTPETVTVNKSTLMASEVGELKEVKEAKEDIHSESGSSKEHLEEPTVTTLDKDVTT